MLSRVQAKRILLNCLKEIQSFSTNRELSQIGALFWGCEIDVGVASYD